MSNWLSELYMNIRGWGGENFYKHIRRIENANPTWKKVDGMDIIICYIDNYEYQIMPYKGMNDKDALYFKVQNLQLELQFSSNYNTYDVFEADYYRGQEYDMLEALYKEEEPRAKIL